MLDGYGAGPSAREITQLRRSCGVVGSKVNFVGNTSFIFKMTYFMKCKIDEHKLICKLYQKLEAALSLIQQQNLLVILKNLEKHKKNNIKLCKIAKIKHY